MKNEKRGLPQDRILLKLGFTAAESAVYSCLLRLGEALPTDLSRQTGLYRPTVYKALRVLTDKGLARLAPKGKRTSYVPESPDKLERLFKEMESSFFNDIEDIHKLYETSKSKLTVTMTEGEESTKNIYLDVVESLGKNETYYRYSSVKQFRKRRFMPKDYEAIRDRKSLERLVITGSRDNPHSKLLGRNVKVIPKEFDPFNDEINVVIYKDKVAIVDYNSLSTMTIKHQKFAEFQKKIFRLLFSKL